MVLGFFLPLPPSHWRSLLLAFDRFPKDHARRRVVFFFQYVDTFNDYLDANRDEIENRKPAWRFRRFAGGNGKSNPTSLGARLKHCADLLVTSILLNVSRGCAGRTVPRSQSSHTFSYEESLRFPTANLSGDRLGNEHKCIWIPVALF